MIWVHSNSKENLNIEIWKWVDHGKQTLKCKNNLIGYKIPIDGCMLKWSFVQFQGSKGPGSFISLYYRVEYSPDWILFQAVYMAPSFYSFILFQAQIGLLVILVIAIFDFIIGVFIPPSAVEKTKGFVGITGKSSLLPFLQFS